MKTHIKYFMLLCTSLALTACAGVGIGGDHIRWTEEVKLSDGRVIQIQRHGELTESGFPVQKRGFDKYHEICYPPLGIHWKSKPGYLPDIFDIVDGKAYMHVPVTGCVECRAHGDPSPNALYFVWDNEQWKRITHAEFPSRAEWNLLQQVSGGSSKTDPQGLISIADKTTGQWNDSALRYDQTKFGWKRVNDDYFSRDACQKCGRSMPNVIPSVTTEILINDGKTDCQP